MLLFGSAGLLFGLAPLKFLPSLPTFYRRAAIILLCMGFITLFPRPGEFYAALHVPPFTPRSVHFQEGLDAVVLTYEDGERMRNYINGQGHGYRPGAFFLGEAFEGLSYTPSPRKVLVIGFGAGSITEAALLCEEVQQVTVVELSGSLIVNLRKSPQLDRVFSDDRVRWIIEDGRRYLLHTEDQYDLILMDPLRTTSAYSNNLHSRQFFALAGGHLAQEGILMVGGLDDWRVIARTLQEEFEHVRAYSNFCLASKAPLRQNRLRFDRLMHEFPLEIQGAIRKLSWDALEGQVLREKTAGYPVNQDWQPFSEYYLGLRFRRWIGDFEF